MACYVDDMHAYAMGRFHGMRMSHMIADSEAELHAMADAIGVKRRWYQGDHYDIALSKRSRAVELGAIEITWRQCGAMSVCWRTFGRMPPPGDSVEILHAIYRIGRGGTTWKAAMGLRRATAQTPATATSGNDRTD